MNEVERRSMGYSFDQERLQHEVANGALAGYDGLLDRSNGMAEADEFAFAFAGSQRVQAHLQDVRWEIASMEEQRYPSATQRDELLQLRLDEILLKHQAIATETVEENPKDTKRLIEALDEHDAELINYIAKCLIKEDQNTGDLVVLPPDVSQQEVEVLDKFIKAPRSAAGPVNVARKFMLLIGTGATHPAAAEAVLPDELVPVAA